MIINYHKTRRVDPTRSYLVEKFSAGFKKNDFSVSFNGQLYLQFQRGYRFLI